MNTTWRRLGYRVGLGAVALAAISVAPPSAAPARAQASEMAGIGTTETITGKATVKSVDQATRVITLVGPDGDTVTLTAGPEIINFDKIKAGDTVAMRYDQSTQYVLSPRGAKTPKSSLMIGAAGAAKGEMPAGKMAGKLVVTGVVVGLDAAAHSLQIVNPAGGPIRTVHVTSDAGMKNFGMIKVGDSITAVKSESIAASVEPAM